MREEILRMIEKNSKINLHDMAVMLGKDEKEIANEIQDMENEKIICGYHGRNSVDYHPHLKVKALCLFVRISRCPLGYFDYGVVL